MDSREREFAPQSDAARRAEIAVMGAALKMLSFFAFKQSDPRLQTPGAHFYASRLYEPGAEGFQPCCEK